jgi:hypothetical protein
VGSQAAGPAYQPLASYEAYLQARLQAYERRLIAATHAVISQLELSPLVQSYLMRSSLQLKSTSDEGLQKVQDLSCYQAYLVQLSLRMHELLGKKVAFFATPFARDRSLEVVVRNFVHSARKSQKEFSGFLSGALNEFVDRYFREMLLLTYLSLAGNLAWAMTTLLCSVLLSSR